MAREFESVISFTARADNLFATVNEINARIQGIGKQSTVDIAPKAGAGSDWQRVLSGMSDDVRRLNTDVINNMNPLLNGMNNVSSTSNSVGLNFGRMTQHMVASMFIWQAMNTAMSAVRDVMSTVVDETVRLDESSARLSVTLGTSKESATAYAQAMSAMGAGYGMRPEESLPLAQYAARVGRGAGAPNQQELMRTAIQLGQVTGEEPKKLMDDLNVTYRQTGISVAQLGDMAVRAWQNSGTSASEYLNILREVGPLAKQSGIDIDKMAGIAAQAADRMGGSLSDAANTLTRLIKAVTEPNQTQENVLLRYGIPFGQGVDVTKSLTQVAGAGMSAGDLAALGGRPGMPQVANDIRTMIATISDYNGELQKGTGLQESYSKSTDSMKFAYDRLDSSLKTVASSLATIPGIAQGATTELNILALGFNSISQAINRGDFLQAMRILSSITSGNLAGIVTSSVPLLTDQSEFAREDARALSMSQRGAAGTQGIPTRLTRVTPEMLPVPSAVPDFSNTINVSTRTSSEVQNALQMTNRLFQQELSARSGVYRQAGFSQSSIDQLLADFREKVMGSNAIIQAGGQMQMLQGPQAYYFQQAIQTASAQSAQGDRLQSLRDHLDDLRMALDDLNSTEKKRAQLEGQWNVPAGATLLVPLTAASQALMKEHGGETEEQATERRRQQILREISVTEERIRREEALGSNMDGLSPVLTGTTTSISSLGGAAEKAAAKLRDIEITRREEAAGDRNQQQLTQTRDRLNRWEREQALQDRTPTGTYQPGMQGQNMSAQLSASFAFTPAPINLDGQKISDIIFPRIERRMTLQLNYTAMGVPQGNQP